MSDGIEIQDQVDDGAVIVRLFEGASNGVCATLAFTGEVADLGVLALSPAGCDELVRALGYDVTDEDVARLRFDLDKEREMFVDVCKERDAALVRADEAEERETELAKRLAAAENALASDRHMRERDVFKRIARLEERLDTGELNHRSPLEAMTGARAQFKIADENERIGVLAYDLMHTEHEANVEITRLRAVIASQIAELDRSHAVEYTPTLTPETREALAEQCRSGRGEQSISRYHALARQALQSAADWLRRAQTETPT